MFVEKKSAEAPIGCVTGILVTNILSSLGIGKKGGNSDHLEAHRRCAMLVEKNHQTHSLSTPVGVK